MLSGEQKQIFWKWLFIILAIFLFLLIALFLSFIYVQRSYSGRIYPNIYIDKTAVGGMTVGQAEELFNKKIDGINQNGITVTYDGSKTTIMPVVSSVESDLAYEVINFDLNNALNAAGSFGHSADSWLSAKQFFRSLFLKQNFTIPVSINTDEIKKNLADNFLEFNQPAENARLTYTKNIDGSFSFAVQPEKSGKTLSFDQAMVELNNNLATLDNKTIGLKGSEDKPQILMNNVGDISAEAQSLLNMAPLTLKYNDQIWTIKKDILVSWLALKLAPDSSNKKITIGFDSETVKNYLDKNISAKINKEPLDAKFEAKDGRIVEFQAGQDGIKINPDASLAAIETALFQQGTTTAQLVVEEYKSAVKTENINDLGIKEIIATGQSNFKGSPSNRRHNIRTGANKLNGILIKPDEEFSLVKTLGDISASTGYLPELVIKENKTTPEFGGGLCQIGTTMFRGALATGLPITMRRNHSYRVSYYEPAGTDATIYDPLPDLRFINDTGNYILIQARFDGDIIYFDFWGTKDGRVVEQTKPTIYNIVKPAPTKIVETLDLKPGEKKCTEKAHNGADAYFDYKVTYLNNDVKEKRFSSHYVPWREVCLLGVKELSTDKAATSTPAMNSVTTSN